MPSSGFWPPPWTAAPSCSSRLHAEETDAYRLFHGTVEGSAGLTVDRYGDLLLVQSFHSPLPPAALAELEDSTPRPCRA